MKRVGDVVTGKAPPEGDLPDRVITVPTGNGRPMTSHRQRASDDVALIGLKWLT